MWFYLDSIYFKKITIQCTILFEYKDCVCFYCNSSGYISQKFGWDSISFKYPQNNEYHVLLTFNETIGLQITNSQFVF